MKTLSFFDHYALYNQTNAFQNVFKSDPTNKTCRFCKRSLPHVTFNNIPHVIPELFGRNNITSNFECDTCNVKFQRFENDAATFIQHHLALLNIKSKRGVPTFQSKKQPHEQPTILTNIDNKRLFNFNSNLNDFHYDEKQKKLTVKFRTRNFIPFHVYKVFLKMGMSLLNDTDIRENEHFFDLLHSEQPIHNNQIFTLWRYRLTTKYFQIPVLNVYKARQTLIGNTQVPEFLLTLYSGALVFQMFMPFTTKNLNEHTKGNHLHLELFPSFGLENFDCIDKIVLHHFELDNVAKVSITDTVDLFYDRKTD